MGLAGGVTPSFGFGYILLDNYLSFGPDVTYGPGSGGIAGTGLDSSWTAGLYSALGDVRSAISADPAGYADPATLGGGLTLGTGPGSTVAFYTTTGDTPGEFSSLQAFQVNDNPFETITVMIVAYNGSSYATSLDRGHSAAFTMVTSANTSAVIKKVGDFMPGFSVIGPVPEPSTLVLGGLGLAALMLVRRKKA